MGCRYLQCTSTEIFRCGSGSCNLYGRETSMEWHSAHMTMTMTWLVMVTVNNAGREDGGTTPACIHN